MHKVRFDLQQVLWVTSLMAVALAIIRLGGRNDASVPDALFFVMIVVLYPVFGLTRKLDPGVRFILVGSVMLSIVINGIILAASELRDGDLDVIAWSMRLTIVGVATTLWLCFTLDRG